MNNMESALFCDCYDINDTVLWIQSRGFKKVGLQFPEHLLGQSPKITLELESRLKMKLYILGETSYANCCIDEITSEHIVCDAIVHYGDACLSKTDRLPVKYVFEKTNIDVSEFVLEFQKFFPDVSAPIILLFSTECNHLSGLLFQALCRIYPCLILSDLDLKNSILCEDVDIRVMGRKFTLKPGTTLKDYTVLFVGKAPERTLINYILSLGDCAFTHYNPDEGHITPINKLCRAVARRLFLIEKAKDAKIVGILIGTLVVSDYMKVVEKLKKVINDAGKKSYIISVGRIFPEKLANFPEIDVFVLVACSNSALLDSRNFYKPIVTPMEMELACAGGSLAEVYMKVTGMRSIGDSSVTDFHSFINEHIECCDSDSEPDVSLITGSIRALGNVSDNTGGSKELVVRDDGMQLAEIHQNASGEYLQNRSWRGLDPNYFKTAVPEVTQGLKGIASGYKEEGHS